MRYHMPQHKTVYIPIVPDPEGKRSQDEAFFNYRYARTCIGGWPQNYNVFSTIATKRYSGSLKEISIWVQKWCDSAKVASTLNEKKYLYKQYASYIDETLLKIVTPFLVNTTIDQRVAAYDVVECQPGNGKVYREAYRIVAQIGINQNPSFTKRINRLYARWMRDSKKFCNMSRTTQTEKLRLIQADSDLLNKIKVLRKAISQAIRSTS